MGKWKKIEIVLKILCGLEYLLFEGEAKKK